MLVSRSTSASIHSFMSASRLSGIVGAELLPHLDRFADEATAPCWNLAADGHPLVHQRREHDPPAVADVAEPLGVGDPDVGEVHLVELGLAGDLVQRPHLDARRVHVDHEVGHALVLRRIGVGAGDQHPPSGEVRQGGPHLLTVDDPLVAVEHGPGRQPGDVGARTRLGEELAPDLLAREERAEVALLLGLAAVRDDGGRTHAVADDVAHGGHRRARPRRASR